MENTTTTTTLATWDQAVDRIRVMTDGGRLRAADLEEALEDLDAAAWAELADDLSSAAQDLSGLCDDLDTFLPALEAMQGWADDLGGVGLSLPDDLAQTIALDEWQTFASEAGDQLAALEAGAEAARGYADAIEQARNALEGWTDACSTLEREDRAAAREELLDALGELLDLHDNLPDFEQDDEPEVPVLYTGSPSAPAWRETLDHLVTRG
jgi:hypothetical protein